MNLIAAMGAALAVNMALAGLHSAGAQLVPGRVVRIVTGGPGGGTDFVARLISPRMSANLGTQVIVENRQGASGIIAAQTVVKAAPDGHTLLLYGNPIWLLPFLRADVPYDVARDFAPVTLAVRSPNVLVVHPSVGVESAKALIDMAKAQAGTLNYAATGSGTPNHMAAELFRSLAGIQLVKVTYKGTGAAMTGLLRGEVQLMFATVSAVLPHIKSGKLRALAVTSAKESALLPGVPTVAASGLPGYESVSGYGIFAPARTVPATVNALNQSITSALKTGEVREKLLASGVEPVGDSPAEFAAFVRAEMARMGKVIKEAGIKAE